MKSPQRALTREQLLSKYPQGVLVPGWFFRVEEVSAGVYRIEASDSFGRLVGLDELCPDAGVEECKRRIRLIEEQLRS